MPKKSTELPTTDLFLDLTPQKVLAAVETGGLECNNVCYPLNSFENRVYEVELKDRTRVVAKFYRPQRWTKEQILEEHTFLAELAEEELPVCTVRRLPDGSTLQSIDGIYFCLADRSAGRAPDELNSTLSTRLGRLVGRLHNIGGRRRIANTPGARRPLDADHFVRRPVDWLRRHGDLPADLFDRFARASDELAELADQLMRGCDTVRIHADLHLGNVLLRDDLLRLLDFDDMTEGPAVQDVWLALPGRDKATLALRNAFLDGYEQFRLFDLESLRLIEALRGLRIVRYCVWLARRWHDPAFRNGWPQFGTREYWQTETNDLEEQLQLVRADLRNWKPDLQPSSTASVDTPTNDELTNKDYFWDWEGE